ncbi:MAG: tautomerase family protein [Clostridia bacterium]|nr:tautomerase family protein [Clostridia bacterium]MBR2417457.1 tautomerase family protein [Clostridia bacterium]
MPFINTRTSAEISKEQEILLKEKMGKAISLIGKSESWLMLNFEDNCRLYFKGDNSKNMAIIEVALFGKANNSQYDALTEKLTEEISEVLKIDPSNVYIKYEEVEHWGYNGFNF